MVKRLSYTERLLHMNSVRVGADCVRETDVFKDTIELVDGRKVRKTEIVKEHPADRFNGFKVCDFSIDSISSAGAVHLLRPMKFDGSRWSAMDSIPEPIVPIVDQPQIEEKND